MTVLIPDQLLEHRHRDADHQQRADPVADEIGQREAPLGVHDLLDLADLVVDVVGSARLLQDVARLI